MDAEIALLIVQMYVKVKPRACVVAVEPIVEEVVLLLKNHVILLPMINIMMHKIEL